MHAGTGFGADEVSSDDGAGTPAAKPARNSRVTMSWVSSQIMKRRLTNRSTASTTLLRYCVYE